MSAPLRPRDKAELFLEEYFAHRPEGAWKADVVAAATEQGIGQRTLEAARKRMGIASLVAGREGAVWRPQVARRGDEP